MTTVQHQQVSYAVTTLHEAIDNLIGLRRHTVTTETGPKITVLQSRYDEIRESLAGAQGTQFGVVARSMPPLWVDAVDWLTLVDAEVREWRPSGTALTWERLQDVADHPWRPQDLEIVAYYTRTLEGWAKRADELLYPDETHRWELTAACPACGTKTVHRKDSGGEYVRQAALQLTADVCSCMACKATWGPQYFLHLATVLGCTTPQGILE